MAGLLLPGTARAQAASADPQKRLEKARSGQPLTPAEKARLRADMMQQAQQRVQHQLGPMPPKVQAVMAKARSGQPLTAQEKATLRQWAVQNAMHRMNRGPQAPGAGAPGAGAQGAAAHRGMARYFHVMGELDAATPSARSGADLGHRPSLGRSGYLRLVRLVRDRARAALGASGAAKIDKLARRGVGKLNEFGVMIQVTPRAVVASAYALALAALKRPGNPLIASNLGVALYNTNDLGAAYDVLGYANALHPKSGVILSNRAFAAMYLGDIATAQSLFHQAIAASPKLPDPEVGLALIARAQGQHQQMIMAAGRAIAKGSPSLAPQAIEAQAHAHESEDKRAQDTPIAEVSRSVGGIVIDMHAGSSLRYPVVGIPVDFHRAVAMIPQLDQFEQTESKRVVALTKTRLAVDRQYAAKQEAKAQAMAGKKIIRLSPRILAVLTDLSDIYGARDHLVLEKWDKTVIRFKNEAAQTHYRLMKAYLQAGKACGDDEDCGRRVTCEYSRKFNAQGREYNAALSQAWVDTQTAQRNLLTRYFKESDPYLDGIADPMLQQVYQINRVWLFRTDLLAARHDLALWMPSEAPFAWEKCQEPPKKKKVELGDPSDLLDDGSTAKPKPGICIPPPGELGLGPADLSWDCTSLTVQGGEGLIIGATVQFAGTKSGHTETSIFGGIGGELSAGPAKLEAKSVIYMTATSDGICDGGLKSTAGASITEFGAKASFEISSGASLRSGPTTSHSAGVTLLGMNVTR